MLFNFRQVLVVLLCLAQVGCATQALHRQTTTEGSEEIKSFLITQDGQKLIIAGEEHHFIFPLEQPLKSLLTWQGRAKLTPSFDDFNIEEGQKIHGYYTLQAKIAQLTDSEQTFLRQHSFKPNNTGDQLEYSSSIDGTRYLAGHVKVPQTAYFQHPYTIKITEPEGPEAKIGKIALTPITLAVDGVTAVLGGVVLMPLLASWILTDEMPSVVR